MRFQMISILILFLAVSFGAQAQAACASVVIPQSFTPNNDGSNDLLRITSFVELSNFNFTVYNNWGEIVYKSDDPHFKWDGTSGKACVMLPVGVYAYLCSYSCQGDEYSLSGDVTLLR